MASCYADTAPPEVFNWQLAAGDRRLISPPPLTFNRQCVRGTGYRWAGARIGEEKRQRTLISHRPEVLRRRERSATVLHVKKEIIKNCLHPLYAAYVHCCSVVFTAAGTVSAQTETSHYRWPETNRRGKESKASLPIISYPHFHRAAKIHQLWLRR